MSFALTKKTHTDVTIIKESFKKVFLSLEPLFCLDRNRYTRLLGDDFTDLIEIDPTKLTRQGIRIDKAAIRKDIVNIFHDLIKAKDHYVNKQ